MPTALSHGHHCSEITRVKRTRCSQGRTGVQEQRTGTAGTYRSITCRTRCANRSFQCPDQPLLHRCPRKAPMVVPARHSQDPSRVSNYCGAARPRVGGGGRRLVSVAVIADVHAARPGDTSSTPRSVESILIMSCDAAAARAVTRAARAASGPRVQGQGQVRPFGRPPAGSGRTPPK